MLFSSLAPTTFLVTSVAIRFAFGDARDVPVNYANLKDLELEDYKLIDTDGAPIKAEKRGSYYQGIPLTLHP